MREQRRPSVSVVIPTYNRHAEVLAAARTALSQTLPPLEVIIVDDGSSQDKAELRAACLDAGVRLLEHDVNKGGGAARNTGIDAARGEWVALLDSDDAWVPDKLQRQFDCLGADAERPRVLAAGNLQVVEPDGRTWLYNTAPPDPRQELSEYMLAQGGTLQSSTLLLPTAFARQTRFNEVLPRHQDWDFVLRLVRNGAVLSYIHEPLVIYNNRPSANRVSQGESALPTLQWFAAAGDLLTPKAKHIFYMHNLMQRHFADDRLGALRTMAHLSLAYPLGVPRTLVRLSRLLRSVG